MKHSSAIKNQILLERSLDNSLELLHANHPDIPRRTIADWIKNFPLKNKYPAINYEKLKKKNIEQGKLRRLQSMLEGKAQAQKCEELHLKACMLYWAEGSKGGAFIFTNCDINMHKIIKDFLTKYFPDSEPRGLISYYPSNDISYEEIRKFWSEQLNIEESLFLKPTNRSKYYKKPQKIKYPYGIFSIQVYERKLLYHIYGAINEYTKKEIFNA